MKKSIVVTLILGGIAFIIGLIFYKSLEELDDMDFSNLTVESLDWCYLYCKGLLWIYPCIIIMVLFHFKVDIRNMKGGLL